MFFQVVVAAPPSFLHLRHLCFERRQTSRERIVLLLRSFQLLWTRREGFGIIDRWGAEGGWLSIRCRQFGWGRPHRAFYLGVVTSYCTVIVKEKEDWNVGEPERRIFGHFASPHQVLISIGWFRLHICSKAVLNQASYSRGNSSIDFLLTRFSKSLLRKDFRPTRIGTAKGKSLQS